MPPIIARDLSPNNGISLSLVFSNHILKLLILFQMDVIITVRQNQLTLVTSD